MGLTRPRKPRPLHYLLLQLAIYFGKHVQEQEQTKPKSKSPGLRPYTAERSSTVPEGRYPGEDELMGLWYPLGEYDPKFKMLVRFEIFLYSQYISIFGLWMERTESTTGNVYWNLVNCDWASMEFIPEEFMLLTVSQQLHEFLTSVYNTNKFHLETMSTDPFRIKDYFAKLLVANPSSLKWFNQTAEDWSCPVSGQDQSLLR